MRLIAILILATATALAFQTPAELPLLLEPDSGYAAPFSAGEKLDYEIRWKPPLLPSIHAGDLAISLDDGDLDGSATYRIQARAVSSPGLSGIVKVDNYYESHVNPADFSSLKMTMRTRQGSRHRDLVVEADYSARRLTVVETDPQTDPPRELRNRSIRNLPGLLSDILSVFYAVRIRELEPGSEYLVLLNDRGRVREVPIVVEKTEKVGTPLGNFDAIRLTTEGGLLGEGREFKIWYSNDDKRVPVSFEADAKLGHVSGKLTKMRTPRKIRTIVETQ